MYHTWIYIEIWPKSCGGNFPNPPKNFWLPNSTSVIAFLTSFRGCKLQSFADFVVCPKFRRLQSTQPNPWVFGVTVLAPPSDHWVVVTPNCFQPRNSGNLWGKNNTKVLNNGCSRNSLKNTHTPEDWHVKWKGTSSIGNTSSNHWFSGWLNQSIWKICSSNWIISPRIGMNIKKHIWVATSQRKINSLNLKLMVWKICFSFPGVYSQVLC